METFPSYKELDRTDGSGLPRSWGVWGDEDQLGTLNNIHPEKVVEAAALVRRGVRFNLDLPLNEPFGMIKPNAHQGGRRAPEQTLIARNRDALMIRDDKLDQFWLQASTQWDGLTHMGHAGFGFYNGVTEAQVTQEIGTKNGIEKLAEFGVATRGVMIDLVEYFQHIGREWDTVEGDEVTPQTLKDCLAYQGVSLSPGDVLLIRMGWVETFRKAKTINERDDLFRPWSFSGLSGGEEMWEFLWDHRVAAVASDTVTVEKWPIDSKGVSLHLAIARLGLTLGEMFDLAALAEDCKSQKNYEFLFTSSPLNIRGGVGSPPNAMAIR